MLLRCGSRCWADRVHNRSKRSAGVITGQRAGQVLPGPVFDRHTRPRSSPRTSRTRRSAAAERVRQHACAELGVRFVPPALLPVRAALPREAVDELSRRSATRPWSRWPLRRRSPNARPHAHPSHEESAHADRTSERTARSKPHSPVGRSGHLGLRRRGGFPAPVLARGAGPPARSGGDRRGIRGARAHPPRHGLRARPRHHRPDHGRRGDRPGRRRHLPHRSRSVRAPSVRARALSRARR